MLNPAGIDYFLVDKFKPLLRVTPAGVKTWVYRYKIDGKTEKLTIGHYPKMGLHDANVRFLELSNQRREGDSPKQLIQEAAAEIERQKNNTVEKLVLLWYSERIEEESKRPQTIKKQIDKDIIPLLGAKELSIIQTVDIADALGEIVKRGAPVHANRVLSSLKQLFNWAISKGKMQYNPYFKPVTNCHGLKYSRTADSILTKNTIITNNF